MRKEDSQERKVQNRQPPEDLKKRFQRFVDARGHRNYWNNQFEQAYRYMMPNRLQLVNDNFQTTGSYQAQRGEQRMNWIFDPTGIESLQAFANNIQMSLMPPYQEWAALELDDGFTDPNQNQAFVQRFGPITDGTIAKINDQLDLANKILFDNFQKARLDQVINEALLDVGISTGVMIVNEGDMEQPLSFMSVPANRIIIEGGPYQSLANFFNPIRLPASEIQIRWPGATLDNALQSQLKNSPYEPVDLIEATLYYPEIKDGPKYYYFVMTDSGNHELFREWREVDPWIAFRGSKSPGEIYGRGPALTALPTVRVLNKLQEFILRSAQMQAYPIIMMTNTGDINPNTINLSPGGLIPFSPELMQGSDPVRPMQLQGNSSGTLEQIQAMQAGIKEIMFANPISGESVPNRTATEASILNNNWIRKNAGFFSRLSVELFPQLVDKSLHILTNRNILPFLDINGVKVPMRINRGILRLQYTNPAATAAEQDVGQRNLEAMQASMQILGQQEGLTPFDISKFQEEVLLKLGGSQALMNDQFSGVAKQLMADIMGMLQQASQPQQGVAPSPAPSTTGSPSPVSASSAVVQPLAGGGAPGAQ